MTLNSYDKERIDTRLRSARISPIKAPEHARPEERRMYVNHNIMSAAISGLLITPFTTSALGPAFLSTWSDGDFSLDGIVKKTFTTAILAVAPASAIYGAYCAIDAATRTDNNQNNTQQ